MLARHGVAVEFYDPLIGGAIAGLIRPETRLVYCESPGSLTFEVQDIPAIAAAARDQGAVVALDNSWASPLYFKPFAHGVDVSIHAATKYLVGHSDAMLGVVVTNEAVHEPLRAAAAEFGACPGSEETYLGLRGLRTLPVRLKRHMETAIQLGVWLKHRPEVACVMHPALPEDPGHGLWVRDFLGASGLFGVVLKPTPRAALAAMVDHLELFHMGFSWGGFESLILPVDPARVRSATSWRGEGPVLRFHAGLEDPDDLIADLEKGFVRLNAAR
jgi:cystathionine beta-lyase